jgi:hypothetical protein
MKIMRLLNVAFVAGMLFVARVASCQPNQHPKMEKSQTKP